MARKASRTNKTAGQDSVQRQRPTGPTATSKPVKCECGNPVCADQWHRLARWLEEDPGNWRKLDAGLKAMWDEADRTFEAAPGLSLVWSGAKIDAVQRQCPTEEGAKPGVSAQPSDESVDKCVEAFFEFYTGEGECPNDG